MHAMNSISKRPSNDARACLVCSTLFSTQNMLSIISVIFTCVQMAPSNLCMQFEEIKSIAGCLECHHIFCFKAINNLSSGHCITSHHLVIVLFMKAIALKARNYFTDRLGKSILQPICVNVMLRYMENTFDMFFGVAYFHNCCHKSTFQK